MKISITCITPVLQAILDFFPDIISFQHVFHLGVDRSQIEWKLKVKTQISVFPWAKIGQMSFQFPLNLTSTNTKVEHMLKANDIWGKKSRIACNTGVIHIISIFTELPCSSSSSSASSSS